MNRYLTRDIHLFIACEEEIRVEWTTVIVAHNAIQNDPINAVMEPPIIHSSSTVLFSEQHK
jgi:hypothetical protein